MSHLCPECESVCYCGGYELCIYDGNLHYCTHCNVGETEDREEKEDK